LLVLSNPLSMAERERNRETILIVDDREENRYIVSRILRRAGFEVAEAADGRSALTQATHNPALVLLDINLPDMTGYEVCRRLKANPATSAIPVIHVSAKFTSNESRVESLEGGADAYLKQPLDPLVLVATVRALLRLRLAETISRLSARQWQSTFDALSEGIALLDNDDRLLRCNRAMCEILHVSYNAIEGVNAPHLLRELLGPEVELEDLDQRQSREYSAQERWLRLTVDPIASDTGERAGRILVLADVTDRKLKEEALRDSEKLAATGRLAHAIAHEINNPLEALTNLLYLATSAVQEEPATDYLAMAQGELERISRITKQTLAFNRETRTPVRFDVVDAVQGVLTLYRHDLTSKSVRCEVKGKGALLCGYPGELKQIVSNLLRNAVDAVCEGGKVAINVRRAMRSGNHPAEGVEIRIADNGRGIAPEVRARIFDAFFTTKQLKGSGLGLWLTASLVAQRDGYISVRTRTGRYHGTAFVVFVPDQP
jgi:two-component system, NtrC family, sensor kinase